MKQKLFVVTGLPYTGKSEVFKELSKIYRTRHPGGYELAGLREETIGHDIFSRYDRLDSGYETVVFDAIYAARNSALVNGYCVAIEACLTTDKERRHFLRIDDETMKSLKERKGFEGIERYFIMLNSSNARCLERIGVAHDKLGSAYPHMKVSTRKLMLRDLETRKLWEQPDLTSYPSYVTFKSLRNNTDEDLVRIKEHLKELLEI